MDDFRQWIISGNKPFRLSHQMWAWKQKHFLGGLTRMRTSRPANKRAPAWILSHWLTPMIYQLGFWTPKWSRSIIIRQTGKMCHHQAAISMTQILNTHREKRKRIFLSLFFLQTNKNKTSIGGYLTCKSDILHIYSFLVPRALGHEHEDQEALGTQDWSPRF